MCFVAAFSAFVWCIFSRGWWICWCPSLPDVHLQEHAKRFHMSGVTTPGVCGRRRLLALGGKQASTIIFVGLLLPLCRGLLRCTDNSSLRTSLLWMQVMKVTYLLKLSRQMRTRKWCDNRLDTRDWGGNNSSSQVWNILSHSGSGKYVTKCYFPVKTNLPNLLMIYLNLDLFHQISSF